MSVKRIVTIDILRGFFIFMIIVDHLERFPSGYDIFTGRGILWMSAAEGFFFLSGLMIGMLRGRKMQEQPFHNVAKKLFKRSLILYLWVVGLTISFTLIALQSNEYYIKPGVWVGPIKNMFIHSFSLQYVYTWSDFLRYYAVYLLASIPAIWVLRKNKWWIISIISVSVWLMGGQIEFMNWQLLFFAGVVIGWYWQTVMKYLKSMPKTLLRWHYPLTIVTLILSFIIVEGTLLPELSNKISPLFLRSDMPILRILIFGLWFSAMYRFVSHNETKIEKTIGKLLIPYGQNSLYVYILHGFIIFFTQMFIAKGQSIFVNFAITTLSLVLIWLAIKKRFLFKLIPR